MHAENFFPMQWSKIQFIKIERTWITLHKNSHFDYQYEKIIVAQWTNVPTSITLPKSNTKQSLIVNYGQIDYYLPFSFSHFLSATISMHSFADHDRTTLKCENHLFYFNLHVNLVLKKLLLFSLIRKKKIMLTWELIFSSPLP